MDYLIILFWIFLGLGVSVFVTVIVGTIIGNISESKMREKEK